MRKTTYIALFLTLALLLSGCGAGAAGETESPVSLTDLTQDIGIGEPDSPADLAEDIGIGEDAGADPADIAGDIGAYVPLAETGRLRVSAMYYDEDDASLGGGAAEIQAAKALFERDHPGWQVLIEPEGAWKLTEIADDDGAVVATVVANDPEVEARYFSELPDRLTENGPDIIALAGADKSRLEREGRLENLLPLFRDDDHFGLDKLLPGVLLSMSYNQALYSMPTSFSVNGLWYGYALTPEQTGAPPGERPDPWTWDAMARYFQPEMGRLGMRYLIASPPHHLVHDLVYEYYAYIYDAAANAFHFDAPFFREVMQTVESLYRQGLLMDADTSNEEYGAALQNALLIKAGIGSRVEDFTTLTTSDPFTYFPLPELQSAKGMAIVPREMFAISAQAKEKAAAWEFMKIMLSDEVQNIATLREHPVVAALTLSETPSDDGADAFMRAPGFDLAAYNRDRFAFFDRIDRTQGPGDAPDAMPLVLEHTAPFFKGEATLDETIAVLQAEADKLLLE